MCSLRNPADNSIKNACMLSNFQNYKIFTPGPTPVAEDILRVGSWQPPYNRTQSFSELTLEILAGLNLPRY